MKSLVIALALCLSAQAAVFDGATMHDAYPGTLTVGGKVYASPNAQDFAAAGWTEHPGAASTYVVEAGAPRLKTDGELAAEAAAAAAAQSNAAYQATLPQQGPATGLILPKIYWLATPGATAGWVEARDITGEEVFTHWYGSPTNTPAEIEAALVQQASSNSARRARIAAIKESPEWSRRTNNIAQYATHEAQWDTLRAAVTNAVAATTGANKAALNAIVAWIEKERQARDDAMSVAKPTGAILLDVVGAQK
jgi:hypothetical protein